MRTAFLLPTVALVACAPVDAPTDLGDLALFFFEDAESEDEVLAVGFENMAAALAAIDLEGPPAERTFTTPRMDPAGLEPIPAGARWENQVPVGGAARSAFSVTDNAAGIRLPDQRPVQSESSIRYDREFITDVECFIDRSCETLEVVNAITKESPISTLSYDLPMTYRWIDWGDGKRAYFVRGWVQSRFQGDEPDHWLDQNYHSELWIEDPEDPSASLRWLNVWTSVTIPGVSDEVTASQTEAAIHDAFERADEWLGAQR